MPADYERAFADALQSLGSPVTEKVADQSAVTRANIWRHPEAHPVVLDMLMLQQYGPEWLSWEPETLHILVPESFKTETLSDLNLSKLQACRTLHLVDSFWQQWEVFVVCAMPFNDEFPDFQLMQVPTVAQCLVACDVARRIRTDTPWSDEMRAYVTQVYHHDGIFVPLPPADFATPEVPESIDAAKVVSRWPEVRISGRAPAGQSHEDEQLRRLLIANTFLEESRTRLTQQLRLTHA